MWRARRTISIVVPRHEHELAAYGLDERPYPALVADNIWTSKRSHRETRNNRRLKLPPLGYKGGNIVALRTHAGPAPETIRFTTDLKSSDARPHGTCDVSRLFHGFFGLCTRKVESVNEPPIERLKPLRKCIDRCRLAD